MQLLLEHVALRLNQLSRTGMISVKMANQNVDGDVVCTITYWYVENLLKNEKASEVIFSPLR